MEDKISAWNDTDLLNATLEYAIKINQINNSTSLDYFKDEILRRMSNRVSKGYIIATETRECWGQGDYRDELVMEQENRYHGKGWFPPIFLKKESAIKFIENNKMHGKQVIDIEIKED